jgi:hypothetical protein
MLNSGRDSIFEPAGEENVLLNQLEYNVAGKGALGAWESDVFESGGRLLWCGVELI